MIVDLQRPKESVSKYQELAILNKTLQWKNCVRDSQWRGIHYGERERLK